MRQPASSSQLPCQARSWSIGNVIPRLGTLKLHEMFLDVSQMSDRNLGKNYGKNGEMKPRSDQFGDLQLAMTSHYFYSVGLEIDHVKCWLSGVSIVPRAELLPGVTWVPHVSDAWIDSLWSRIADGDSWSNEIQVSGIGSDVGRPQCRVIKFVQFNCH